MNYALNQHVNTATVKRTAISRMPQVLCMSLCRRVYEGALGKMRKLSQHVHFPLFLNMDSFQTISPQFSNTTTAFNNSGSDSGRDIFDASLNPSKKSQLNYLLRAVVVHQGSAESGHYYAYCLVKERPERVWEMFSDERHHPVSEADVLASQATLLFYDRIAR